MPTMHRHDQGELVREDGGGDLYAPAEEDLRRYRGAGLQQRQEGDDVADPADAEVEDEGGQGELDAQHGPVEVFRGQLEGGGQHRGQEVRAAGGPGASEPAPITTAAKATRMLRSACERTTSKTKAIASGKAIRKARDVTGISAHSIPEIVAAVHQKPGLRLHSGSGRDRVQPSDERGAESVKIANLQPCACGFRFMKATSRTTHHEARG